jgi:hypothetical protein
MTGIVHVNPVPNHPTWKILLWNGEGHGTGVFIKPNTNWKVYEKKSMNGLDYYRIGTDRQWVEAQYVDDSGASEVAGKAIYTVGSNSVNLVDGKGNASGQVLAPGTKWKAFAKKNINGQTYYRLGSDQQWAPANGGTLDGSVADAGSYQAEQNTSSNSSSSSDDSSTTTPTTPTTPSEPKEVTEWRTKLAKNA